MLSVLALLLTLFPNVPRVFSGDVLVQSNGPRNVMVYLDADRDGLVDHSWVVSSETPYGKPLNLSFPNATIVDQGSWMQIAEDGSIVVLAVSNADVKTPQCAISLELRGFGLASYDGIPDSIQLPTIGTLRARGERAYQAVDPKLEPIGSAGE